MSGLTHIAIDGPSASGKGSASALLSEKLGIPCLDTGAIYRGLAVYARFIGRQKNVVLKEKQDFIDHFIPALDNFCITAQIVDNVTRIILNGEDVTGQIRENEISQIASKIGTIPEVRKTCTRISQTLAANQSLIAEGRDICSVVIPNAKFKFYLTANVKVRAKRRYEELLERGQSVEFAQVLKETKERDERDLKKGGLVKTRDAIVIDSTKLSIDQVVTRMLNYILR